MEHEGQTVESTSEELNMRMRMGSLGKIWEKINTHTKKNMIERCHRDE